MDTIGERIWHVLSEKRMKAQELADHLEVTKQYLYDIKSGRIKNPSYNFLLKFESIGVNPKWIMSGEGEMYQEENVLFQATESRGMASEFYKKILDELTSLRRQLDVKDQQIGKLLDILGKLEVSPEMPPVREGAVVLPLHGKRGFVANSRANSSAMMIA